MTSGAISCTWSRQSGPPPAVATSNPSSCRLTAISCRITSSSSTTSTRPNPCVTVGEGTAWDALLPTGPDHLRFECHNRVRGLVAFLRCAPIAQGIEHRPPEPGAKVRILLGAPHRPSLPSDILVPYLLA